MGILIADWALTAVAVASCIYTLIMARRIRRACLDTARIRAARDELTRAVQDTGDAAAAARHDPGPWIA